MCAGSTNGNFQVALAVAAPLRRSANGMLGRGLSTAIFFPSTISSASATTPRRTKISYDNNYYRARYRGYTAECFHRAHLPEQAAFSASAPHMSSTIPTLRATVIWVSSRPATCPAPPTWAPNTELPAPCWLEHTVGLDCATDKALPGAACGCWSGMTSYRQLNRAKAQFWPHPGLR